MHTKVLLSMAMGAATFRLPSATHAPAKGISTMYGGGSDQLRGQVQPPDGVEGSNADDFGRRSCVIGGKANATCFGNFDPADSTEVLQAAFNSSAHELLIQNVGKPWIVRPLFVNSNDMRIVFEAGTELLAKRDEFHGHQDSLLTIIGMHNISILGNKATFRMRRDDYAVPSRGTCPECKPYTQAEWRMGIFISQSENISIRDLLVTETGGDGIYIDGYPPGYDGNPKGSANIHVADCILDKNCEGSVGIDYVASLSLTGGCVAWQTGRG